MIIMSSSPTSIQGSAFQLEEQLSFVSSHPVQVYYGWVIEIQLVIESPTLQPCEYQADCMPWYVVPNILCQEVS